MSATPSQRALLDLLDLRAVILAADQNVRAVSTRIANRALTPDEADDLRLLTEARADLFRAAQFVLSFHPDRRNR